MAATPFNDAELDSKGVYNSEGTWYGLPYPTIERLSQPITPADNLRRYYRGEDYQWIPDLSSDQFDIVPDCDPDTIACGYEGGYDEFGVKWIPDANSPDLPAFVEPGFLLIEEIEDWKTLTFPDVDSWDWAGTAAKYNEALKDDDRLRRGVIWSGYFERLISIMTFENAAMALLDDPDSVEEFFCELDKINLKKIDHYFDDFGCEAIMIHDDWSAQRAPFFSLDTAMELLMPHIRKLADHVHERGGFFTLHSCGNGLNLIPALKAANVDGWQAQDVALDLPLAHETIGDDFIIEIYPDVPEELQGDSLREFIDGYMEQYASKHKIFVEFTDMDPDRWPMTRKTFYEIGRKRAAEFTANAC